jgi:hypothetical protein
MKPPPPPPSYFTIFFPHFFQSRNLSRVFYPPTPLAPREKVGWVPRLTADWWGGGVGGGRGRRAGGAGGAGRVNTQAALCILCTQESISGIGRSPLVYALIQRVLDDLWRTRLSCRRMICLLPHPLPPLYPEQVVSLYQYSCVSPVELFVGEVGGSRWGRSQIIRRRESLVLYKSFNPLCIDPNKK